MENEAYKEWKKLYSAELNDIWEKECKEIRRAAMVMHILKKEFLVLQNSLDNQLDTYRKQLTKKKKSPTISLSAPQPSTTIEHLLNEQKNDEDSDNSKKSNSPPIKMRKLNFRNRNDLKPLYFEPKTPSNRETKRTTTISPDILESSIIENTPEPVPKRTFRFIKPKKKNCDTVSKVEENSENMGITEMISAINDTDSEKTYVDLKQNEKTAKKSPLVEPIMVVRGKARKNLPGWSCIQCKNFYECQNLTEEQLKKRMDECSRHRSKFKPPDDTFSGFWDLTIKSQDAD